MHWAFFKKHLSCTTSPPSGRLQNTVGQACLRGFKDNSVKSGHGGKLRDELALLPGGKKQIKCTTQLFARHWTTHNKGQESCETGNKQGQPYSCPQIAALKEIPGHRQGWGERGSDSLMIICQYLLINCNCVTLIQDVNYRRNCVCKNSLYIFSVNLKSLCIVCVGKVFGALGVPLGP